MAIDFPSSPATNQQYTYAGKTYTFSGTTWVPTGGGAYTASSTAPTSATPGDHWYDLSTGVLSIYVNDGTSSQWVMVSPNGAGVVLGGAPQGRLTLQTGAPVMTTTQSAKTIVFYTPYVGSQIPIYNGSNMLMTTFSELSVATTDTTKSPTAIGVSKVNDWFVWNDVGTIRLSHGPDWTNDTTRSAGTAIARVTGAAMLWVNAAGITNGPGANFGTYVGTTRSNASSQLDWIVGGSAAGGLAAVFGVWNCYNRVSVSGDVTDSTGSWTYVAAALRSANASINNRVSWVYGLAEDCVDVSYCVRVAVAIAGANGQAGFALDAITPADRSGIFVGSGANGQIPMSPRKIYQPSVVLGFHFIQAIEASDGTNTATYSGGVNQGLMVCLRM